jgi:pseudaminic acid cytidylyltransferase
MPLLGWAIEVANESGLFSHVVVSTESPLIADIAMTLGAEVPYLRPAELADDFTPTVPVIQDAIQKLNGLGFTFDNVCCIYPGAVAITPKDLTRGYQKLLDVNSSSYVFAVVEYPYPIQRALSQGPDGSFSMEDPLHLLIRSQDLPKRWHDAGQFYWGRVETWLGGAPLLEGSLGIEMPSWRVQDIDTEDDWARAELIARLVEEMDS